MSSTSKPPKLRWRVLRADIKSPFEKRQELFMGTAYIGVVEPLKGGKYLARAQNGGPYAEFSSLELAKTCLEDYAVHRTRNG